MTRLLILFGQAAEPLPPRSMFDVIMQSGMAAGVLLCVVLFVFYIHKRDERDERMEKARTEVMLKGIGAVDGLKDVVTRLDVHIRETFNRRNPGTQV